ncbi:MAG TPA: MBOAT family O-acyltransferase [Bacteroidales bacterium]|nr:MBOAT family O-acyltransferase [Bacteroidales bacterium]HSA43167.1 MBOAT family O-acyltransferase [Bacteroidales bacterium]
MIFNSSLFLVYFLPVFLLLYYLTDKSYRNWLIIAASTLFFAWGAPVFVLVVWTSILADHYWNRWMNRLDRGRKLHFVLILVYHTSLLLYFKYANFLVDNTNELLRLIHAEPLTWTPVLLPLGISFITFQKISYSIDVYRKHQLPAPSLAAYAAFIFMFPKILAGPIVRYREMAETLEQPDQRIPYEQRISGFFRFVLGLARKVLIANTLGESVDLIFAMNAQDMSTGLAWVGALAYTFQIYFDFAGYSDMAIGLAAMTGFRFPENFNNPYTARSITEFWRRWHITLSSWLRDYIFLPLAYRLSDKWRRKRYAGLKTEMWIYIIATAVTMLLCGFWHGAAWTFILWGAYQGLVMIIERLFLLKFYKKTSSYLAWAVTFIITVNGWVLFRSPDFASARDYLARMWSLNMNASHTFPDSKFLSILILAAVVSFLALIPGIEQRQNNILSISRRNTSLIIKTLISIILLVICLAVITSSGFNPFIYFRF